MSAMDFAPSARATEMLDRLQAFLDERVFPAEPVLRQQGRAAAATEPSDLPAGRRGAQGRGPGPRAVEPVPARPSARPALLDYAPLAELTGWSPELAPEAMNCAAPDTGNMEVLRQFGTPEQQCAVAGTVAGRADPVGFCMTEPDVASSDATQHRDLDPPRRRRVRGERPQVVVDRSDATRLRGAGRDGPSRDPDAETAPAAVDGPGAAWTHRA